MKVKDWSPVNVPIKDMSQRQIIITAEALWAMKTAPSDCSSDGTPRLFQKMFPGLVSVYFVKRQFLKNKVGKPLLALEYAKKDNQLPISQM